MFSDIFIYLASIFGHWQTWLSGGGIGGAAVVALTIIERLSNYKMPRMVYVSVFVVAFFLGATFLAWRDQFNRANSLFGQNQRLVGENDVLKNKQPSQQIVVANTAEEERLREEVRRLQHELDDREVRKRNRLFVGQFLAAGNAIKEECNSLESKPYLDGKAVKWANDTAKELQSIDPSFTAMFQSASGGSYARSIGGKPLPPINDQVWNWVNIRTDALNRILESMPR